MKQSSKFALTLLFLSCAAPPSPAEVSPSAAPVVRILETRYRDVKTLKAAFLQTYRDGRSGVQVESGTAYFSRPGRMRWEYETPEPKLFIADGKTVWFYVPADHTVTRSPTKESDDWRTPLALLTGKAKLSDLCEQVALDASQSTKSGTSTLVCVPKGTKVSKEARAGGEVIDPLVPVSFDRVFLEVDSGTGDLTDVRIIQQGGVEIEFRFGQWQQGLPLESGMFRLQIPPGVTVVDGSSQ